MKKIIGSELLDSEKDTLIGECEDYSILHVFSNASRRVNLYQLLKNENGKYYTVMRYKKPRTDATENYHDFKIVGEDYARKFTEKYLTTEQYLAEFGDPKEYKAKKQAIVDKSMEKWREATSKNN